MGELKSSEVAGLGAEDAPGHLARGHCVLQRGAAVVGLRDPPARPVHRPRHEDAASPLQPVPEDSVAFLP